jgi:hypothetical protein
MNSTWFDKLCDNPIVLSLAIVGCAVCIFDCFRAKLYFAGFVITLVGLQYLATFLMISADYLKKKV